MQQFPSEKTDFVEMAHKYTPLCGGIIAPDADTQKLCVARVDKPGGSCRNHQNKPKHEPNESELEAMAQGGGGPKGRNYELAIGDDNFLYGLERIVDKVLTKKRIAEDIQAPEMTSKPPMVAASTPDPEEKNSHDGFPAVKRFKPKEVQLLEGNQLLDAVQKLGDCVQKMGDYVQVGQGDISRQLTELSVEWTKSYAALSADVARRMRRMEYLVDSLHGTLANMDGRLATLVPSPQHQQQPANPQSNLW